MKHISILVPRGEAVIGCIEGPHKLFNTVNTFLQEWGKEPAFSVQLVGLSTEPEKFDGVFSVSPDISIEELETTDLIIIPAVNGTREHALEINKDFTPWIQRQYTEGSEVASLCVGAFLLAETGLLNGKECTTHWQSENDFRRMFPEVNLVSDKILTDEQGIYTSGGANSFWNLLLHILEKYIDREMAVLFAKYYAIEIDRYTQSPFSIFSGQKSHKDEPIKKVQDFIEKNVKDKTTVEKLADMSALSKRSFERRFKKATSNTVAEYIQRVKVEVAKKHLEGGAKNVSEVMYDVGYSDTKAFRSIFKRFTGLSPIEYRNRYLKADYRAN